MDSNEVVNMLMADPFVIFFLAWLPIVFLSDVLLHGALVFRNNRKR